MTEYTEDLSVEVTLNTPATITFSFPQTAGTTQSEVTGSAGSSGTPIGPTAISGRTTWTANEDFTLYLGYELGGDPTSGSCVVTPTEAGQESGTIQIDDPRREVKTFAAGMDFQTDGNVLVSINLSELTQEAITLIEVKAKVGSGTIEALTLDSLEGQFSWDGATFVDTTVVYVETRPSVNGRLAMLGSVLVTNVASRATRSATIHATGTLMSS